MVSRFVCVLLVLLAMAIAGCASSETPGAATPLEYPPADISALIREAQIALDGGNPDAAIEKLRRALEIDETSAEAHFVLGGAYAQKEQFPEAEREFLRTLDLDESNNDARSNLGVVCYRQGKLEEAESAFRLALSQQPNDAEIHYNLGGALAALNRLDEALAAFQTANQIDPSLPEPYLGLGSVYKLQGHNDEAIAALKKYVELSQDADWRGRAEQMLRELGEKP